jgi:hypothetical protein
MATGTLITAHWGRRAALAAATFRYGSRYYLRDRDTCPVAAPVVPQFPAEGDR